MNKLSIEDFCLKIAEILETGSVTPETDFRSLPEWCSLQAFGMLVFLENDCGLRLDIPSFSRLRTVGEIYALLEG